MMKQAQVVDTALNGFDGFQLVLQKKYDFNVCDLQMPVMEGFQFAQRIKSNYEK